MSFNKQKGLPHTGGCGSCADASQVAVPHGEESLYSGMGMHVFVWLGCIATAFLCGLGILYENQMGRREKGFGVLTLIHSESSSEGQSVFHCL